MPANHGHQMENPSVPFHPTLIGWFPRTTVPLPLLSENHCCAAESTLVTAVAFGTICPSWTVVIGPDIHL